MRLKSLVLSGFKSFADKTIIEFDSGITAIVGPNGCGKSNVVDAFRWVLGEQSARSIRGERMLDLIFSGASSRKALGMAEVSLTFTEAREHLPLGFSEVTICRRVFKNGESEYLINRNPVRLKDIESLFWDTGLGKDAFCIFEQGKIDQVIQSSPTERRAIFEEAAGILRFKQRKKEALKRMEQAETNFSRAQDIYLEVNNQCQLLEKQARDAELYTQRKEALEEAERDLLLSKWHRDKKHQEVLVRKKDEKESLLQAQRHHHRQLESQRDALQTELVKKEISLNQSKESLLEAKGEKEIKQLQVKTHLLKIQETDATERSLSNEHTLLKNKILENESRYQKNEQELKAVEEAWKLSEEDYLKNKVVLNELQKEISSLKDVQKGLQQERMVILQSESKARSQVQEHRLRFESSQERLQKIQLEIEHKDQVALEHAKSEEEKKEGFLKASQSIDFQKNSLNALEKEIHSFQEEIKKKKEALALISKEKLELLARQKVLLRLREDMEGCSSGTKRLLQEARHSKSPLFKKVVPLYERLKIPMGLEMAFASLLKPYVQTLLVQSRAHLQEIIKFAYQEGLKEYSLLCLEDLDSGEEEQEVLKGHFLRSVVWEESVTDLLTIADGQSHLTKEGEYKDLYAVFFASLQGEKNSFLREAELQGISSQIELLSDQLQKGEQEIKDDEVRRETLTLERNQQDKAIRILEMKLVEINFGLQKARADQERVQKEKKKHEEEAEILKSSILMHSEKLLQSINKESELKKEATSKQEAYSQKEEELRLLTHRLKQEEPLLREKEALFQKKVEERQRYLRLCHGYLSTQEEQKVQLQILENKHLEIKSWHKELSDKTFVLEAALKTSIDLLKEAQDSYDHSKTLLEPLKEQLLKVEELCKQAVANCKKQELDLHQLEVECAQGEALLNALEESVLSFYQSKPQEWQLRLDLPLVQLEALIHNLKEEIEKSPAVNLAAIEEFEASKAREELLRQQLEDSRVAKEEIIRILNRLDEESRKLFLETFMRVKEAFQKNFTLLFDGGEADLTFTDSKDCLEAGIEISAKPFGKQMRSISLLSGGEKCLTAMALLFAIFQVKPSPFCLLDEVDAPLDDANIGRFTNMLKKFMDKTQFIAITHNKRTMSVADRLFGISMEERGISKMIAVSLQEMKR